jgi:hypothetical protein
MAVSHHHTLTQADFTGTVTVLNSAGVTATVNGSDLWHPSDANSVHDEFFTLGGNTLVNSTASGAGINWAASGGISLAGSSNTIVISSPVVPAFATINQFEPYQLAGTSAASIGQSSIYFEHVVIPEAMSINRLQRLGSVSVPNFTGSSNNTGGWTNQWGYTETVGVYTRENGASSGSFSLLTSSTWSMGMSATGSVSSDGATTVRFSQSIQFGFPSAFNTAGGYTSGTFSSTGNTSSAATSVTMANILSNVTGPVIMQIPLGMTLSADEYVFAFLGASNNASTGTATTAMSISEFILSGYTSGLKSMGQTATATGARLVMGNGVYSVQSGALPNTFAKGDVNNNSNLTKYFVMGYDT